RTSNHGEAISCYLDRQDVYRCGYPFTPFPKPVCNDIQQVDQDLRKKTEDLRGQITMLLSRFGVHTIHGTVVSSQWRFTPHRTTPRQTVTIYSVDSSDPGSWPALVKAIAELYSASGRPNVQVEILDPDKIYYIPHAWGHMVPSTQRDQYREIYDEIFQEAHKHIGHGLLSIELGRYKKRLGEPVPKVSINIEDNTQCDWDGLIKSIMTIASRKMGKDTSIRLQPAKILPASTHISASSPANGTSVSPANCSIDGTLGIFVNVKVPEGVSCPYGLSVGNNLCALTNHHVVAPKSFSAGIMASSKGDTQKHQPILSPGRNFLKEKREQLEHNPQQRATNPAEKRNQVKPKKSMIKEAQAQLRECQALESREEFRNGTVVASSGVKNGSDRFIHDVAVVSLPHRLASSNLVPAYHEKLTRNRDKGGKITHFQDPRVDDAVVKDGATSRTTEGVVVARSRITRKDENSTDPALKDSSVTGDAWSVAAASQPITPAKTAAFATFGDSGSLVSDKSSAGVGQIHSVLDEGQGAVMAYMAPASAVLAAARALLPGCQVEFLVAKPSPSASGRFKDRFTEAYDGLKQKFKGSDRKG
ncbi:MAG: hypothetical protein LQ338_005032, partial [Usnochroma carphineum]